MIAGGLVAKYGLRACARSCAGRCALTRVSAGGHVEPSRACELMAGPPPLPGKMPPLVRHDLDQLRAMARRDWGADGDVAAAAKAEIVRRAAP